VPDKGEKDFQTTMR